MNSRVLSTFSCDIHPSFYCFGGSERAQATPRLTHGSSRRFVFTPSKSTRTHPRISRPRITIGATVWLGGERVTLLRIHSHKDAALAARRHRHVPADQKREAAEHLLSRRCRPRWKISSRILLARSSFRTPSAQPSHCADRERGARAVARLVGRARAHHDPRPRRPQESSARPCGQTEAQGPGSRCREVTVAPPIDALRTPSRRASASGGPPAA